MSLQVSSYPNPYSTTPITDAYAWIAFLAVEFASMEGRLVVNVHTDGASALAGLPAIAQDSFELGKDGFPDLATFISDNQAAFDSIRSYLYGKIAENSKYANSTEVA